MTILNLKGTRVYHIDGVTVSFRIEGMVYIVGSRNQRIEASDYWIECVDSEIIEIMKAIKKLSDEYDNKANRDHKDLA